MSGSIKMWCSKSSILIHDFGQAHDGSIECLKIDTNSHYFYSGGSAGKLKKWDSKKKVLVTCYGQAHGGATILSIAICREWMFTADGVGRLKCWAVGPDSHHLGSSPLMAVNLALFSLNCHKDFGPVHSGGVEAMAITNNGQWLFTTDHNGFLKQWAISETPRLYKNYGNVMCGAISAIAVTNCDRFLFVTNEEGDMRKFDIGKGEFVKFYEKIMENWIYGLCVAPQGDRMWMTDNEGFMKCWDIGTEETVKDYKKVGSGGVHSLNFISC